MEHDSKASKYILSPEMLSIVSEFVSIIEMVYIHVPYSTVMLLYYHCKLKIAVRDMASMRIGRRSIRQFLKTRKLSIGLV